MRTIYTINATHVVVSESHPEGVYSVIPDYPKRYDSRDYQNSDELAMIVAKAEFADRVKQLSLAGNRAMWTVTLERSDGRQIDRKTYGTFPEEPQPAPEPEPEEPVEEPTA